MHKLSGFLARHIRAVVVGVLAVVIIAGGATIALASSGGGSPAAAAPTATTTTLPPTTTPPAARAHRHVPRVRGAITTMTASQWTITTPKGTALTVTIGPDTKYGTPKAPATASSFTTGENVVVLGKRQGTTVQATRIAVPAVAKAPAATTPTTTGA